MRILLFLLFPVFLSAQINRAYGVIEIGSTFPASSSTGPKYAYRTTDSSFYRWIHTNVWVKVVEPSITPDTLYLQQISGTTAIVNGDTINLTPYVLKTDTTSILAPYIKLAGWGLTKLTSTLQVDTSKVATRYYAKTLPTSITSGQVAYSNGSNLVGSSSVTTNGTGIVAQTFTHNDATSRTWGATNYDGTLRLNYSRNNYISSTVNAMTYYAYDAHAFSEVTGTTFRLGNQHAYYTHPLSIGTTSAPAAGILLNLESTTRGVKFPLQTLAQADAITGVQGNFQYETTQNGLRWYNGTRKAYALESTFARGTATRIPFFDANGQVTDNAGLAFSTASGLAVTTTGTGAITSFKGTGNPGAGISNALLFQLENTNGSSYKTQFVLGGTIASTNYFAFGTDIQGNGTNGFFIYSGAGNTTPLYATSNGRVSIGTTGSSPSAPARTLAVLGEARITDLTTDPPTQIVGADADGDLGVFALGGGLSITSGTLSAPWLKTELEAGRDVDITGGTSTDLRLRSNTRIQFDGKFKVGADSAFQFTPSTNQLLVGTTSTNTNVLADFTSTTKAFKVPVQTSAQILTNYTGFVAYTGFLGGGGYVPGTYTNVPVTTVTGVGSGLTGTIFVHSGGTVIGGTVTTPGTGYAIGDLLTISNIYLGGTGSGVSFAVSEIGITTNGLGALAFDSDTKKYNFSDGTRISELVSTYGASKDVGIGITPTEKIDVNGDAYIRDSLRVGALPNQTTATKILSADASGWVGYRSFSDFASTWLKPELESVGNVKITTTNSLTFNTGITRWTAASNQTGTYISPGYIQLGKTSAGNFGGLINFADTIARDNGFFIQQDDRSNIQNYGTGRQLTIAAENTSLPSTYRWAFGARVDTSTTALSTLRVMLGDRYAGPLAPVTVSVNAGVQPTESVANAAVGITVLGDVGKKAFTVNDAITTRMNGKVYFGLDSTLAFDPSTDLLRLSQYGIGNKKASDLGLNKPTHLAAFSPTGTGQGTIVDYPLDSIPTNSIYNNLPNGNVSIDADGNNLEINNLYELNLASSSGETYLAFYDDDSFEIRSDQEIDIGHSLGGRTRWGQNGIIMSAWSSVPRVYYNQVYLDSVAFKVTTTHPTPGTTENVFNVALENGSNEGLVTLGKYTYAAPFTALTVGEDATDLFLTTTSTTGKVIGKAMRQTTKVKDADLTITDIMLDLSMDIHVWAYCSNAASDSVVIDLPTPGTDYLGQMVSVYGDGRNATPNRDVYVRCVGAKLWHGNASPTGETYYQVTSLALARNSKTAEFTCVQNPDDNLYYWQLKQHP